MTLYTYFGRCVSTGSCKFKVLSSTDNLQFCDNVKCPQGSQFECKFYVDMVYGSKHI